MQITLAKVTTAVTEGMRLPLFNASVISLDCAIECRM